MSGPALPKGYGPNRRKTPPALKLWVAVIIANIAGILISVWTAGRLRAIPAEASTETWLFALYYGSMFVTAIVDALWLDEILFKGAFRLTHLQGKTGDTVRPSDDVETVAAATSRSTVSFPVLLILSGVVSYFAFNAINGNFNFFWRNLGVHMANLRGDDEEGLQRRLQAIAELSIRRAPHDRTLIPRTLIGQLERGGEEAVWAAWALGRFSDLPGRQRGLIHEALTAATRGGDDRITREATVALARLQYRPVAKTLAAELDKTLGEEPVDRRLVYSTGWIQSMTSVPGLTAILSRGDIEAQRIAAWALAQHRDEKGGREVVKILEDRLPSAPFLTRCAIVHALMITSDEASNRALMHAYDVATPEELEAECPVIDIDLRPDGQGEPARLLEPVDTYEMKILQTMGALRATDAELRGEVEPWLEKVAAASEEGSLKQSRARSLLEGIRSGRDDTELAPPAAKE
jgi:hypothetical protein